MSPVFIAIVVIVLAIVIGLFVWKITSESKAKKNYRPPVASEKVILPEMRDEELPAKSGRNLRFCPACGEPNSDKSAFCVKCGNKL